MSFLKANVNQGTNEWLELRQKHITATDAAVIMGLSKWKTPHQLYMEKTNPINESVMTPAMERGLRLEPFARELFALKTGHETKPDVLIKDDWLMASLDGLSECGKIAVEIKCPGGRDHETALKGKVPEHYYPQLQHQILVTDLNEMYYFSFDGFDGVVVKVERDEKFIEKMLAKEIEFYGRLKSGKAPDLGADDFEIRTDWEWQEAAERWKQAKKVLDQAQEEEKRAKELLSRLAGKSSARGAGISVCQVTRKGAVDYNAIPELKNVDVEAYRKPSLSFLKISEVE